MKRPTISKRVAELETIGANYTARQAMDLEATGQRFIPLWGTPNCQPAKHVKEAALKAVEEIQFGRAEGLNPLREALAKKLQRENGITADPETEIVVTYGAMESLFCALQATIDPGDEVLSFSPIFFFYGHIHLAGGKAIYAHLDESEGFRWNVRALEKAITKWTKLLIINTPQNPTGYVATREDLEAVAEFARRHDLFVLCDESYDRFMYDGRKHVSFASLPGVADRAISVFSCTKSYALPMYRTGYVVANADICRHIKRVHEWITFYPSNVCQRAALAAIEGPQEWLHDIPKNFQRMRDTIWEGLNSIDGLSAVKPQGGPYLWLNVSELGMVDPEKLSRLLMREAGIETTPAHWFQSTGHLRVPFGGELEDLRLVVKKMAAVVDSIRRT
ncbi:MAG: pyridoxal phosphate-dependent aminotransferase [Verrucomicrobia bacterium]|nr:pyridoxal phosphate-dependent aminotransferase [Verrucomicrobiota bacterium]